MAVRLAENNNTTRIRQRIDVRGIVQGVGFRPYIYREATKRSLTGWVQNGSQGVTMEVEGATCQVNDFLVEVKHCPLPLARIETIQTTQLPPANDTSFLIRESSPAGQTPAFIPADVAACRPCREDVRNEGNRRHLYPFTNCTDCGPRYTIIQGVPYDREKTTMSSFKMCESCAAEYLDPTDRRFHAQPNACPDCGPQVRLLNRQGEDVGGGWRDLARTLLKSGSIMAIKGLGGFHLACDANNAAAIQALRRRKGRPFRPFAVMCSSLSQAERHCYVSEAEKAQLLSPQAPIVVLQRRPASRLPEILAPGINTLGMMLPYTPLHELLFDEELPMLVMTSGNESGLPLARENDDALRDLSHAADYFLVHNRPIHRHCDDSLLQVVDGYPSMLRRSRGYVPHSVSVPTPTKVKEIFAAGGDLKNIFCFLKDGVAYPGPHIGDVTYAETGRVYLEAAADLQSMLQAEPAVVAVDCHPGYRSAVLAGQFMRCRRQPVWHHHAHMASCMAENLLTGPVIGIICDGTGYGRDGTIWGGEVLSGDYLEFQREFHLQAVPMPGGEAAVRHPWRMAVSYAWHCLPNHGLPLALARFPDKRPQITQLCTMMKRGIQSPHASSCGRLYDAVAALLGICRENTYDGQAPRELAEAARGHRRRAYPFTIQGTSMSCSGLMGGIAADLRRGRDLGEIAASFEQTLVEMFTAAARRVHAQKSLKRVVLSGGSFQNPFLTSALREHLSACGFQVYTQQQLPANDGGLALGQALVAAWKSSER